jgi:hypothetical protein
VAHEDASDLPVEAWLKTLGIDSLVQWDVLAFVYRHRTSLIGGEAIAGLLGHATDPVVAALDVLESLALVARSRATHGVRLYQFTLPPDPTRRDALERLNALAESRAGRLRLRELLRPRDQAAPEARQAARDVLAGAGPVLPMAKLRPAPEARFYPSVRTEEEGGEKWLKVI